MSEPSHINITRSIFRLTTSQNRHSSHLRRESSLIPLLLYTKYTQKSTGKDIFFVTFFLQIHICTQQMSPLGTLRNERCGESCYCYYMLFRSKMQCFFCKKIIKHLLQAVYLFLIYDDIVRSSASIFSVSSSAALVTSSPGQSPSTSLAPPLPHHRDSHRQALSHHCRRSSFFRRPRQTSLVFFYLSPAAFTRVTSSQGQSPSKSLSSTTAQHLSPAALVRLHSSFYPVSSAAV